MTFLSILLALLVERILPQLVELRQFEWMGDYSRWLQDVLRIDRLGQWGGLALVLLPVLVLVWLLAGIFHNALFGLFELVFNVAVVFLCLGPRDLDKQVDRYLDGIELGDDQQRFTHASELCTDTPATELPIQVVQVSKSIFAAANSRVYAMLFWFALLGPIAAVSYRLLERLLTQDLVPEALASIRHAARASLGVIDWLPARLTLFAYMISGSFDEGLQAYRRGVVTAIDAYEQNVELLQHVGLQSIGMPGGITDTQQAMQLVRKSRGLVLRALVAWLLLILLITVIG